MEQIAEHPLEENLAALRRLKEDYPDKVCLLYTSHTHIITRKKMRRYVSASGQRIKGLQRGIAANCNPSLCLMYA